MSRLGLVVAANRFFSLEHPSKKRAQSGTKTCPSCSQLNVDFCSCHALPSTDAHHHHIPSRVPPAPLPPLCLAVYLGLCGSDCGAPLQEFGSGRGLESRPTLSPIQRPARCEVGKFHSAIQVQWPPQRRLQAPAHSCRDLGAAQVRGGPG